MDPEPAASEPSGGRRHTPRSNDRVLSGAAAGWAERWAVEPTVVRAALGLLSFVGGLGIVLYALAFATTDAPHDHRLSSPPAVRGHRRELAVACVVGMGLVVGRSLGVWPGDAIMIAATAAAVGVSVAWIQPGARVLEWSRRARVRRIAQVGGGVGLVVAGVGSLANQTGGLGTVGASASAIAVVVAGIAVFTAPVVGRTLRSLDDERTLRIREDERARVSAHLHDSVLQSLVLIQRSDDPRHMTLLARRQERALRSWLYDHAPSGEPRTISEAVAALVTEIESDHDVRVEAIVVGNQPLDDAADSLVAALREAVVNAANHADVDRVDVFVEADDTELTGFVRDTGCGFDLATVTNAGRTDHRGITDSIIGRVERAGGSASIETRAGAGTEVELRIPRITR